jgi:hypothetical protein
MWMREGTAMMRVSNITLAHYCLGTENAAEQLGLAKATDFSLDMARDLIDARAENTRLQARITELEGRSGYCVECERLARKVGELESQLAGAREDRERLCWLIDAANNGEDTLPDWVIEDAVALMDATSEDIGPAVRKLIDAHRLKHERKAAIAARKAEELEAQLAGARDSSELLDYVLKVERDQGVIGLLPLTTTWTVKDGISYTTPMINKLRAAIAVRKKEV